VFLLPSAAHVFFDLSSHRAVLQVILYEHAADSPSRFTLVPFSMDTVSTRDQRSAGAAQCTDLELSLRQV